MDGGWNLEDLVPTCYAGGGGGARQTLIKKSILVMHINIIATHGYIIVINTYKLSRKPAR